MFTLFIILYYIAVFVMCVSLGVELLNRRISNKAFVYSAMPILGAFLIVTMLVLIGV